MVCSLIQPNIFITYLWHSVIHSVNKRLILIPCTPILFLNMPEVNSVQTRGMFTIWSLHVWHTSDNHYTLDTPQITITLWNYLPKARNNNRSDATSSIILYLFPYLRNNLMLFKQIFPLRIIPWLYFMSYHIIFFYLDIVCHSKGYTLALSKNIHFHFSCYNKKNILTLKEPW